MTPQQEAKERRRLETLASPLILSAMSTIDSSLVSMFRSVGSMAVDFESSEKAKETLRQARDLGWSFVKNNAVTDEAGQIAYSKNDIESYAESTVSLMASRSIALGNQAILAYDDNEVSQDKVIENTLNARRNGRAVGFSSHAVHESVELGKFEVIGLIAVSTVTKTWWAVIDAVTRQTHIVADGQEVNYLEDFIVGGYRMRTPRDPRAPLVETANCRCQSLYSIPWSR